MTLSSPVERFLACALADDPAWHRAELAALWREAGDAQAWAFATRNNSESIAGIALSRVLAPAELPRQWVQAIATVGNRIELYMEQLDRTAAALAADGICLVALKNSGIARGIFTEPGGSPMGDVDVLVDPRDFRRAHEKMVALGYSIDSRSPLDPQTIEEAEREGGLEYTLILRDGSTLWFELQWRPVAGRWIRPDQEPSTSELIAASVPCAGTTARLLAPAANLLQVCLHTAKHSYVRAPGFRLHTDVDRIVRRSIVDWDAFVREVNRLQVRTAVYFSLLFPSQLLHTPVPGKVLQQLSPRAWKKQALLRSILRAGLFDPEARKWSKLGYIWFNLLLYDTLDGVWRAIFPPVDWICRRYHVRSRWTAPWWYGVRLVELCVKRANT